MQLKKELIIFDMDGVLYRNSEPIPLAITTVNKLMKMGKKVAFLTNNSSKSPNSFTQKLRKMKLDIIPETVFTSATITAKCLQLLHSKAKVYLIGEEGLHDALSEANFSILNDNYPQLDKLELIPDDIYADIVVTGWDTKLTYGKLRTAMMLILKGAIFYGTNNDTSFPAPNTLWPGSGATIAYLSSALNQEPKQIFGKPEIEGIQTILHNYKISSSNAVLVGDRISTDILGGNRAGLTTILVETGINSSKDINKYSKEYHPTFCISQLSDIFKIIE